MEPKDAYETGARKYPAATGPDPHDDFSQDAAGNKPPAEGFGNASPRSDTDDKTRHSEGRDPPDATAPKLPGGTAGAPAPGAPERKL